MLVRLTVPAFVQAPARLVVPPLAKDLAGGIVGPRARQA